MWFNWISLAVFLDNCKFNFCNASFLVKLETSTPFIETPDIILSDFEVSNAKINELISKVKINIVNSNNKITFFLLVVFFSFERILLLLLAWLIIF